MKREAKKDKFSVINRLLLDEYVLVHLNPKIEGVTLPPHLMENETVTLKLSKLFRGSMIVEASHIQAELLFNNNYFSCIIPFLAVWGATSTRNENTVWPESAPSQLLNGFLKQHKSYITEIKEPESAPIQPEAPLKKKAHLTRVK